MESPTVFHNFYFRDEEGKQQIAEQVVFAETALLTAMRMAAIEQPRLAGRPTDSVHPGEVR
jgi:hypothetical protein